MNNNEFIKNFELGLDIMKDKIHEASKPALEFHHSDIHERLDKIEERQEIILAMLAEIKAYGRE